MQPKPSQASETRRKLIRGSLAAPVVLTVSSASAASVTSFGKCLARLNNEPTGPFFTGDATIDNWLRKQVEVVQLKHGSDIDWFYLDPGISQYVRLSSPTVATGLSPVSMAGWQQQATGSRWALVWVDSQQGSMYSLMQVQQPIGYQASTKSCYTSLLRG
jgi:hypothetical protein